MRNIALSFAFCLLFLGILLVGCNSTQVITSSTLDDSDLNKYAIKESNLPKYFELVQSNRLSLKDVLQMAKKKNLQNLLANLEEEILSETSNSVAQKKLAKIISNYDYILGDNTTKLNQSFEPQKISSLLNFSLAYFNSKQPTNLTLQNQKRLERANQNLVSKVLESYVEVATAQRNVLLYKDLWEKSCQRNNPNNPESLVRLNVIKKHLLDQVALFRQKCAKLAAITGFENEDEISVDDLFLTEVIDFEIPSTKLLEQMALILRPELNELTLSKQLQLSQCRKAIDDLFSEVRISYENNEDWNRNFYINSFVELAYKSAYKLLLLADNKQKNTPKQFSLAEIKLYTPAIAVISHVRIAQILWDNLNREYKTNNQKFQSLKDKAKVLLIVNKSSNNSDLAQLDNTLLQLATLESKRIESMSKLYSAYYLLLSTIGIDNLDSRTFAQLQKVVKQKSREAALFFAKENSPKEKNSSSSTKQSTNQVNTFSDVDFLNIYQ